SIARKLSMTIRFKGFADLEGRVARSSRWRPRVPVNLEAVVAAGLLITATFAQVASMIRGVLAASVNLKVLVDPSFSEERTDALLRHTFHHCFQTIPGNLHTN